MFLGAREVAFIKLDEILKNLASCFDHILVKFSDVTD